MRSIASAVSPAEAHCARDVSRRLAEGLEALGSSVEPRWRRRSRCISRRAASTSARSSIGARGRQRHAPVRARQAIAVLEHARAPARRSRPIARQELDLQILERMGNAYYALGDIERSARTYASLATRAADAGLLAEQRRRADAPVAPGRIDSVLLARAGDRSRFRAAYVSLSRIYSNLGEIDRARRTTRRWPTSGASWSASATGCRLPISITTR